MYNIYKMWFEHNFVSKNLFNLTIIYFGAIWHLNLTLHTNTCIHTCMHSAFIYIYWICICIYLYNLYKLCLLVWFADAAMCIIYRPIHYNNKAWIEHKSSSRIQRRSKKILAIFNKLVKRGSKLSCVVDTGM